MTEYCEEIATACSKPRNDGVQHQLRSDGERRRLPRLVPSLAMTEYSINLAMMVMGWDCHEPKGSLNDGGQHQPRIDVHTNNVVLNVALWKLNGLSFRNSLYCEASQFMA